MRQFTTLWLGQMVSILGSSMTRFALILWIYQETENVTATALLGFFGMLPYVLVSPFAGMIVDKYNRKVVMFFSDLGAAFGTLIPAAMVFSGSMEIWMIYLAMIISGLCEAFQSPAMSASITLMVPEDHYARANAMRSFAGNASRMTAPILAGALIGFIGLEGIILIDFVTFFVGIMTVIIVRVPNPSGANELASERVTPLSLVRSYRAALKMVMDNQGLLTLMIVFILINLITGMTYYGIFPAYILSRSGNDSLVLGTVESMLGLGGVVGSLMVGISKMPQKKVKRIFIFMLLSYITGDLLVAIGNHVVVWGGAVFITSIFIAYLVTYEQVVWQTRIRPEVQGRVFAFKGMAYTLAMQVGYLFGGILADQVFEPLSASSGVPDVLRMMIGSGKGSGMAMMFLLSAVIGVVLSLWGLTSRKLMTLDREDADKVSVEMNAH